MFNASDYMAPAELGRWRNLALGVGGICTLILFAVGFGMDQKETALRAWLLGFMFSCGLGVGGLGILILQYLTGGAWGVVIRRTVEACSRTIPYLLLLFIPVALGVKTLYEWSHLENDPVIQHRGWYLTWGGFVGRAVIYFVLWGVMQYLLNKWSANQDRSEDYEESAKWLGTATAFSGPTMVIFVLVVSFAAIDWTMTLDPHWFSTIWGFLYVAGWALSCFSFAVAILAYLSDKEPMNKILGKRHFHDIGKLMLALVMVWAYFNFSQFLIIWSGNIPEETVWFLARMKNGWGWIGLILILFHFAFPYLVLLSRDVKRNAKYLAIMAIFIMILRIVDVFYHIAPSPSTTGQELHFNGYWILYLLGPLGAGGIWLFFFFRELASRPLVPVKDPFLENAIEHGKGH
ncbi:MAG: hypothetical protein JSS81_20775 [Acidobacteria bacterium]|nr:hypothetical protein [Acidobacteriota bacterium]